MCMDRDPESHVFDYMTARLAEIHEALAELDAAPDPLAHEAARRILVSEAARLVSALATFEHGRWPSLN